MDRKIKIIALLLALCPILLNAQSKVSNKYIDSSELQLKLFASENFYLTQVHYADSTTLKKSVDIFMPQYFETSNYQLEAIQIILEYSKQEASKDYVSDERGKCLCYNSSLLFFNSYKLNRKIKSLRKYLNKKPLN